MHENSTYHVIDTIRTTQLFLVLSMEEHSTSESKGDRQEEVADVVPAMEAGMTNPAPAASPSAALDITPSAVPTSSAPVQGPGFAVGPSSISSTDISATIPLPASASSSASSSSAAPEMSKTEKRRSSSRTFSGRYEPIDPHSHNPGRSEGEDPIITMSKQLSALAKEVDTLKIQLYQANQELQVGNNGFR